MSVSLTFERARHSSSRHHHPADTVPDSGQRGVAPVPTDQSRGKGNCSDYGDENDVFEHFVVPPFGPSYEPSPGGNNNTCRNSDGKIAIGSASRFCSGKVAEEPGNLSRAVEKLVEGLMAENQRLESVVDQLQVQ